MFGFHTLIPLFFYLFFFPQANLRNLNICSGSGFVLNQVNMCLHHTHKEREINRGGKIICVSSAGFSWQQAELLVHFLPSSPPPHARAALASAWTSAAVFNFFFCFFRLQQLFSQHKIVPGLFSSVWCLAPLLPFASLSILSLMTHERKQTLLFMLCAAGNKFGLFWSPWSLVIFKQNFNCWGYGRV